MKWLSSDVEVIKSMANSIYEKFDKYWHDINGPLAIAIIVDPRNKMDCVEFYFQKLYGDSAELELSRISNFVVEYQRKSVEVNDQDLFFRTSKKRVRQTSCRDDGDDEDEYAQSKKTKRRKVNVRCEVDHYLEDDPLADDDRFDILLFRRMTLSILLCEDC